MIAKLLSCNYLITIGLFSWLLAQLIKVVGCFFRTKRLDWRKFFESGGMPSSHSAFVSAITMGSALWYGVSSPSFSLALTLAAIVMYDAMGVRQAAGKQAKAINDIQMFLQNSAVLLPEKVPALSCCKLQESIGHKPIEVLGGALLGATIAVLTTL